MCLGHSLCVHVCTFVASPWAQILHEKKFLRTSNMKSPCQPIVKGRCTSISIPGDSFVWDLALQTQISSPGHGTPTQLGLDLWEEVMHQSTKQFCGFNVCSCASARVTEVYHFPLTLLSLQNNYSPVPSAGLT